MPNERDFIRIIKENEGIIFKITIVYSRDADDQQDLYQEIVYQLWKSFDSFRNESKVSTCMYRIALNTAIAHLEKEKRTAVGRIPLDKVILERIEPDDPLMEERISLLYAQIKNLNPIEKGLI